MALQSTNSSVNDIPEQLADLKGALPQGLIKTVEGLEKYWEVAVEELKETGSLSPDTDAALLELLKKSEGIIVSMLKRQGYVHKFMRTVKDEAGSVSQRGNPGWPPCP